MARGVAAASRYRRPFASTAALRMAERAREGTSTWRVMEFEDIERILELVRQHDLAEFELEREGLKIRVRKASAAYPMPPALPAVAAAPQIAEIASPRPPAEAGPAAAAAEDEAVDLAVVKSPIVGTFYRTPE